MLYVTSPDGKFMCALYKSPRSKLRNVNILYPVWFSSGRNKLVQLLIWSTNSGG